MLTQDEVEEQVRRMFVEEYAAAFNQDGPRGNYVETFAPRSLILTEPWDGLGRFVDQAPDGCPGDAVADDYIINLCSDGDVLGMLVKTAGHVAATVEWRSDLDDIEITPISPVMALVVGRGSRIDKADGATITPIVGIYIVRLVAGRWKMVAAISGSRFA